jgi:hypothetical protein
MSCSSYRPSFTNSATHGARPLSGTKPPSGYHQAIPPTPTPNQDYLTPGALPPRPFPRMLASLGPSPQHLLLQRLCPTGYLSPALATRHGHPCASTILPTLVYE